MAKKKKDEAIIDETPEIEVVSDAPINAEEEAPVVEEAPKEEPKKAESEAPKREVYVDEAKQI